MTTSRIVRGTKGRIFIYICAILIVTGIIACYNSTRIELENVQKSNNLCHQQQENLSTSLQVISDYKQRLEHSLKTEKAEHQQTKAELESKVNEERLKYDKLSDQSTLKFNSLTQHYNLLQTQHDDLKDECAKKQKEQLDIINNLQAKLKEIQGQLMQSERKRENTSGHLKSEIEQLKADKAHLENHIHEITKQEDGAAVDKRSNFKNQDNQETLQAPNISDAGSNNPNFAKQLPMDNSEYKIAANNVGDHPPSIEEDQMNIKPPENGEVLAPPNKVQSSTPNALLKSSRANMEVAPLLKVPTMTPETAKNKTERSTGNNNNPEPIPSPSKKLPEGVVAMQDLPLEEDRLQNSNDAVANLVNNRYRNVADEGSDKDQVAKENVMVDAQERENIGNEIFDVGLNEDPNLGNLGKHEEEKKNHFIDNYDQLQANDANVEENEDVSSTKKTGLKNWKAGHQRYFKFAPDDAIQIFDESTENQYPSLW